jgi:ATPase subunit of ABC transporter with duplicated ATPase domains
VIDIIGLGKSFGAQTLFADVSLKLVQGARYGLVGANGSGKTTFLEIVAGDEPATEGSVTIAKGARVGVLRQDRFMNDGDPILDVAMAGDEIVSTAYAEQRRLVEAHTPDAARLAELEDRIAAHDGYTLEARASAILEGLGIPVPDHREPLGILSGGFKLRVLLAQVLLGGPDVLLLDEPTNHLDILSIRWLEQFLAGYAGCAVVISHDERFLDTVSTHILDVDYETVTAYVGNYGAFVLEKAAIQARNEAEIDRAEAVIAEKRAWVERFGAKATKARQAQSRLKQIERIEVGERRTTTRRAPMFQFTPQRPSGKDVLTVDAGSNAYGDKKVLARVSLVVRRGERVAILGPNGLGKSTLLKIATGNLHADGGTVKWGHEAHVGYFPQDHHEVLQDGDTTPLDVVWSVVPSEATSYVRGQLGRLLFSGDDVSKKVGALSGGEAARLVFCKIMVQKPNVLVLDEPTNHLDLEAIHALSAALKSFEGALVFVSHDRAFVSALATRILEVTPRGFHDFPGTYAEFLDKQGDDHLDAEAVVLRAKRERRSLPPADKAATPPTAGSAPILSREEQKRLSNRKKNLPSLRDTAIAAIEAAEARKGEIHARWCEPRFYQTTPDDEIARLEAEEKLLSARIGALTVEWEVLEKEMEGG